MSENSNSKVHALYLILILLLLGGLVFTNIKLKKSTETIRVTTTELNNTENLKAELEKEYQKALDDLEVLNVEKAGVDSLLTERVRDLEMKKKQISELIKSGQTNKADLDKARLMIKQLQDERLVFQTKIDSLVKLNDQLNVENVTLTNQKNELTETISTVQSEKSKVEEENSKLKSTVNKAKILTTSNIKIIPTKSGRREKEVEVKKAKDTDALKICFDLLENRVAPTGETEMAIRIVNPSGATIQIQELGSGNLTDATTGNSIPYTYLIRPDYQNEAKTVCSIWNQSYNFTEGNYSVEIYQSGLLIGQGNFNLK
ncbi:MAG: hypothetical protein LC105_11050 [Chitinophagales bacterium]|nr:hypothetical protein [Chitinophagales bacterium]MCZ2394387.1 hypothetical protein [Chitinophagales bacterium]